MKCIDPTIVAYDDKGKRVFRSFSKCNYNVAFIKNAHLILNCGKCIICRKKSAFSLAMRCVLHSSLYKNNMFLTLTYDEKMESYHNNFQYEDIQKFKKRLRNEGRASYCDVGTRKLKYYYFKKIEIFNVHEYGKNGKKHWHLIVFNHEFEDQERNGKTGYLTSKRLLTLWPFGHHTIGDVTTASAMYQAQYMEKDFKNNYVTSAKRSHSKHSGIGRPYFLKHYSQILSLGYIPMDGKKVPIPRYFEKLAHKHYCHFYDQSYFHDTKERKAPYRPFKAGQENQMIAELYMVYRLQKEAKIQELEKEWDSVISQFLTSKTPPDFIKSGENTLYDLQNKIQTENF